MKQYPSYKATEIKWLRQYPSHWILVPSKRIFSNPKQKNIGEQEKNILALTLKGVVRNDPANPIGLAPSDYSSYQIFDKDDLVFKLIDLENVATSRVGIVPEQGAMSSAYIRFSLRNNGEYIRYFFYQYYDLWLRHVFNGLGAGVRQTLSADDLGQLKIVVPPLDEQRHIVKYIDWKTSEINQLINVYQKQIKLLEEYLQVFIDQCITSGLHSSVNMKESKAEWMGFVPASWQEMRIKDICREKNIRSVDGKEPHLSMSQKRGLVTDDDDMTRPFLSESYIGGKVCEENDLVLNRLKAHLGVFALAPQIGVISPDYTVLKIDTDRVIPKYAEYMLKSNSCRRELVTRVRGITEGFWRLYTEDLYSIRICIPSLDEQAEILSVIETKERLIKDCIGQITKEIELIAEYKKTLISSVVTGQVDVRDAQIPEYATVELNDVSDDSDVEIEG